MYARRSERFAVVAEVTARCQTVAQTRTHGRFINPEIDVRTTHTRTQNMANVVEWRVFVPAAAHTPLASVLLGEVGTMLSMPVGLDRRRAQGHRRALLTPKLPRYQ